MMISLAIVLNQIANLALPALKSAGRFVKYTSNEAYLRGAYDGYGDKANERYLDLKTLAPDELAKERQKEHRDTLLKVKSDAIQTLFESLLWFLVAATFFTFHWSINKRIEKS